MSNIRVQQPSNSGQGFLTAPSNFFDLSDPRVQPEAHDGSRVTQDVLFCFVLCFFVVFVYFSHSSKGIRSEGTV
jgi:hypothetical protein